MQQQPTIDQAQPTFPMLTDFHAGYRDGMQAFQDGIFFPEDNKAWTEEDLIKFVETELSGTRYRRQKKFEELMGRFSLSYSHHMGFVMGYVQAALGIMVPCTTCKRPILRTEAQPIRQLESTGRYRAGETVYECAGCVESHFLAPEVK